MDTLPIHETKLPPLAGYVEVLLSDGRRTYQNIETGVLLEDEPKPEPAPTLEERVGSLEKSKANQADVDELHEALNMILTGVTV